MGVTNGHLHIGHCNSSSRHRCLGNSRRIRPSNKSSYSNKPSINHSSISQSRNSYGGPNDWNNSSGRTNSSSNISGALCLIALYPARSLQDLSRVKVSP